MPLVKEMRQLTSAPMKKCVDALKATDGDVDAAVAWLRKAGLVTAQKMASRGSNEGVIAVGQNESKVAVVEINPINSGTDFVARNSVFSRYRPECTWSRNTAVGKHAARLTFRNSTYPH